MHYLGGAMELDARDKHLIALLQANARESVVSLGKQLGVSRTTVQNRIEALERRGVIKKFTIEFDQQYQRRILKAQMLINLRAGVSRRVIKELQKIPQISGIKSVSGIYDLTPIALTTINEPLQLTKKEITENSPSLLELDKEGLKDCQVIIAYGDNETSEFKRQSTAMVNQLTALGLDITFSQISSRNHFDVIVDLAFSKSWLSQKIIKQMA